MIGTNIAAVRKKRGLSLSELADRTGVSKSYLSNIERNLKQNPSIHVVEKIATVLHVDLNDLLDDSSETSAGSLPDQEWLEFIEYLKQSGINKEQIQEYKIIIDFLIWHQQQEKATSQEVVVSTQNSVK